jgi:hypothetical protein
LLPALPISRRSGAWNDAHCQPPPTLPDAAARARALLDYTVTLLVEAAAGSGKTALMAGRVALMLAHGIRPRDIVAITFTEAAAAELLERIERFVALLAASTIPPNCVLPFRPGFRRINSPPLRPRTPRLTKSPARRSTGSANSSSSRTRSRPASTPARRSSILRPPILLIGT